MLKTEEVNRLKLTKHETIFSVKMVKFESADYYHFLGGSFPHKVPFNRASDLFPPTLSRLTNGFNLNFHYGYPMNKDVMKVHLTYQIPIS